jgi:ZIP family zinc transporter
MGQAILWGAVSGSAVLLGALLSLYFSIKTRILGYIMSFGTGVLMGAAAYELLGDSIEKAGITPIIIGFLSGSIIFTGFDLVISKKGGKSRKRSNPSSENRSENKQSGLGIFLGTIMDAIPESIMIGASLLVSHSVSWLLVIAIFISNIPEGLSSTAGMKQNGYSKTKIWILWLTVLIVSTLSSLCGYVFLKGASDFTMAVIASFAGGGIIAMLASTMMPEAFEEGGPVVGFIASAGLLLSLILTHV